MQKNKILILTTDINELGGISSHYRGLKRYFSKSVFYKTVGSRKGRSGIFYLPTDIALFLMKLIIYRVNIVLLNPSLVINAMKRDKIFLLLSKLMRKRAVVFIHGWDKCYEKMVDRNPKKIDCLNKADALIVLCKDFKEKLMNWGIRIPIFLATTKVDDKLIEGFDVTIRNFDKIKFLFLCRIVKSKGVFEVLDAFQKLNKNGFNYTLSVVGDGPQLNEAINYSKNKKISNVVFRGRLDGAELSKAFIDNNIYLFPSYEGEGMPTSVLEALAFGMPVITTKNAGIKDFFQNGQMGLFCKMRDTDDIVNKTELLIQTRNLYSIAKYNHNFAKSNFLASKVAVKLEYIIHSIAK
jgi:glycosyltransferase involved in cell wall biosynthesis